MLLTAWLMHVGRGAINLSLDKFKEVAEPPLIRITNLAGDYVHLTPK